MPAEPPHPCGGRLRIHFRPPVCHNDLWLLDVFRFIRGGVGHASRYACRYMSQTNDILARELRHLGGAGAGWVGLDRNVVNSDSIVQVAGRDVGSLE